MWFARCLAFAIASPVLLAACTGGPAEEDAADAVYVNGRIYTVNEAQPWVEAVAIKDGSFLVVGSTAEVEAVTGENTKVVDLGGKFAMPGLHDIHLHIQNAYTADALEGELLFFPSGVESVDELGEIFREYAEANPDLEVLFAENLPYTLFPGNHPTKSFIDAIVDDRPVYMLSETQHEGLMNSKALEAEGITAATPSPPKGMVFKDPETGEPTGFVNEQANGLYIWTHYPVPTLESRAAGLKATLAYGNSVGLTSVMQSHAKKDVADGVKLLEERGELTARFGLCWTWRDLMEPLPLDQQLAIIESRAQYASDFIGVDCVKIGADGNPGSTAAVLEPYLHNGESGVLSYTDEELFEVLEKFHQMGLGVTAHAIGDATIRQFIDGVAALRDKHGDLPGRYTISHSIMLHPDDMRRVAALGIGVEFSPVAWYPSDLAKAQAMYLGEERMLRWFPMNSAVTAGIRIALASDGPIAWHDPLVALEAAVTRQGQGGKGEPLAPREAIDVATGIKAMTINSAYMMQQEDKVGTLEVGKRADLIVLDKNLLEVPPTEIGSAKVLLTLVDGQVVFDASEDPAEKDAVEAAFDVELDFAEGGSGSPHGQFYDE
jgi:predicted amidohydrolase YtcJ